MVCLRPGRNRRTPKRISYQNEKTKPGKCNQGTGKEAVGYSKGKKNSTSGLALIIIQGKIEKIDNSDK